ncbi:MAG TPA: cellulase family glycosylhydrolase [Candidatus Limnocylindrales bacterium]|nr:cellulase family glycosylhydrolase [Candidatus Limnocylindrales bacterium]
MSLPRAIGLTLIALLVLSLVMALMPLPPLTVTGTAVDRKPSDSGLDWLQVRQGRIEDSTGRIVTLRGFNDDALVLYPDEPPAPIDEQDARLIQSSGFNLVRLGIDWAQLEPVRGRVDTAYLDRVATTVRTLNAHRLYVILDVHFRLGWSPKYGASGAPGWATFPLPDLYVGKGNLTWGHALSPAAIAAGTYFWLSQDWQRDFAMVWQAVARRFRDTPGVAAYDVINEPDGLPIPPVLFEKYWMWPFYQRVMQAIAEVDSNHILMAESILFLNLNTAIRPLHADNLLYGPHLYVGSLIPPFWTGDPAPEASRLDEFAREAGQLPAGLFIGELGIDLTSRGAPSYADATLNLMDDRGLGWAWWQWRQNRYWGIRDAKGNLVNLSILQHLARPYLQAAPAQVTAGRGDGVRGALTVTVAATHGDQPVAIGWSALTLPSPAVTGSCVTSSQWDASLSQVVLDLKSGEGCTVHISAGTP